MYLKKRNSLVVINNDVDKLSTIKSARARTRDIKRLEVELAQLRKEVNKLRELMLEMKNG